MERRRHLWERNHQFWIVVLRMRKSKWKEATCILTKYLLFTQSYTVDCHSRQYKWIMCSLKKFRCRFRYPHLDYAQQDFNRLNSFHYAQQDFIVVWIHLEERFVYLNQSCEQYSERIEEMIDITNERLLHYHLLLSVISIHHPLSWQWQTSTSTTRPMRRPV